MGHRKKPKTLGSADEFLRKTEEYHHYVTRVMSRLRVSQPHYNALCDICDELEKAYCLIAECEVVPWALSKPSNLPQQRFD